MQARKWSSLGDWKKTCTSVSQRVGRLTSRGMLLMFISFYDSLFAEKQRQVCAVESFRRLTGLSCDWSIAVINIIAISLFLIVVITFIWICIKRR